MQVPINTIQTLITITPPIASKNLSIGYELPKGLVSKAGIQQLRIYIAGTNLFTLSSLHKYGVDPEVPEGSPAYYYPQQRTLSVGLNLSF